MVLTVPAVNSLFWEGSQGMVCLFCIHINPLSTTAMYAYSVYTLTLYHHSYACKNALIKQISTYKVLASNVKPSI